MVGNAEPGKEYNYRPLSKLCECQLDVNDQVSTKGPEEGGLGEGERAELRGAARDRRTDGKSERERSVLLLLVALDRGAPGAQELLCFFLSTHPWTSLECVKI